MKFKKRGHAALMGNLQPNEGTIGILHRLPIGLMCFLFVRGLL